MSDPIDRQDAIEAIASRDKTDGYEKIFNYCPICGKKLKA